MNILITGFAGFIGFHLTRRLIAAGHSVWGIDNFNDYYEVSLKHSRVNQLGIKASEMITDQIVQSKKYLNLFCMHADNCNVKNKTSIFDRAKPDIICHLAAQAGVRYSIENPRASAKRS